MLQNGLIRIQKSIHAILHAGCFGARQLTLRDFSRDAFLPAEICEVVDRWMNETLS